MHRKLFPPAPLCPRMQGYLGQWDATLKAIRSVGASVYFDDNGQPQFEVPAGDNTFLTADMHPPSRSRSVTELHREALSLVLRGDIVGDAADAAKKRLAELLELPMNLTEFPEGCEKPLSCEDLGYVCAALPPVAINVAAYRVCMRTRSLVDDGAGEGYYCGSAAQDVIAATGAEADGVVNNDTILPFRFASTRVTGVPEELAPSSSSGGVGGNKKTAAVDGDALVAATSGADTAEPEADRVCQAPAVATTAGAVRDGHDTATGLRGSGSGGYVATGSGRGRGRGRRTGIGGGLTPPRSPHVTGAGDGEGDDGEEEYVEGEVEALHGGRGRGGRRGGHGRGRRVAGSRKIPAQVCLLCP